MCAHPRSAHQKAPANAQELGIEHRIKHPGVYQLGRQLDNSATVWYHRCSFGATGNQAPRGNAGAEGGAGEGAPETRREIWRYSVARSAGGRGLREGSPSDALPRRAAPLSLTVGLMDARPPGESLGSSG